MDEVFAPPQLPTFLDIICTLLYTKIIMIYYHNIFAKGYVSPVVYCHNDQSLTTNSACNSEISEVSKIAFWSSVF